MDSKHYKTMIDTEKDRMMREAYISELLLSQSRHNQNADDLEALRDDIHALMDQIDELMDILTNRKHDNTPKAERAVLRDMFGDDPD